MNDAVRIETRGGPKGPLNCRERGARRQGRPRERRGLNNSATGESHENGLTEAVFGNSESQFTSPGASEYDEQNASRVPDLPGKSDSSSGARLFGFNHAHHDQPPAGRQQHRLLVTRALSSGDTPLIIGVTVGGVIFLGVLIIALAVWHRRTHRPSNGGHGCHTHIRSADDSFIPALHDEKSLFGHRHLKPTTPASHTHRSAREAIAEEDGGIMAVQSVPRGYPAMPHTAVTAPSAAAPTTDNVRRGSWLLDDEDARERSSESHLTSAKAVYASPFHQQVPTRAIPTSSSPVSNTAGGGKKTKRHSSAHQRLGSRDLKTPMSIRSVSSKDPPPPRPPRPEDTAQQVFELSASPSVKKTKPGSKPLPMLPTFLLREQEEEMRRRREEEERKSREEYEKMRRQSPAQESSSLPLQKPMAPSTASPGTSRDGSVGRGSSFLTRFRGTDRVTSGYTSGLKNITSLDTLASTTTTSAGLSDDEDDDEDDDDEDDDEDDEKVRTASPEVNPLSPRSSQRRTTRISGLGVLPSPRLQVSSIHSAGGSVCDDAQTSRGSHRSIQSHLITDSMRGVDTSAFTSAPPNPTVFGPLRLTPPPPPPLPLLESEASTPHTAGPPISATRPPPAEFIPSPVTVQGLLHLPLVRESRSPAEWSGSLHRTESSSSANVAIASSTTDPQVELSLPASAGSGATAEGSERPFSTIEDWRESIGESYAATRPTTAIESLNAKAGSETEVSPPAEVDQTKLLEEPGLQRKISINTGVAPRGRIPREVVVHGQNMLLAPTPSTSPGTPVEFVPVSAVTPPDMPSVLRPSEVELEQEKRKAKEVEEETQREIEREKEMQMVRLKIKEREISSEGLSLEPSRKGMMGDGEGEGDQGSGEVMSWLNFDDDEDSEDDGSPIFGMAPTVIGF